MAWAEINGIRLFYQTLGSGPPLVFAHGAGGNHLSWWQQVPEFARRYRCVTFAHRAFGRTKDSPDRPGRRMFHEDLRELLDLLEIERTAIVAQSMGGRTTVGFALRNPGRVSAIVFAGTTGGAVSERVRAEQAQYRKAPISRTTLAQRAVAPRLKIERPDLVYLYRQIGRLNPPRPKDFLAPVPGYIGSSASRLAELGIPILYLVGSEDTITPPHIIKMAHEEVPGSEFDIIEGAGHSAYFEKAHLWNARVQGFLTGAGWISEGP